MHEINIQTTTFIVVEFILVILNYALFKKKKKEQFINYNWILEPYNEKIEAAMTIMK